MADRAGARALIERYGWNTTCFQLVNPGMELWFGSRDSVVGYVPKHGIRVVGGAPVCAHSDLRRTIAEFESAASSGVCYFGAEGRMRALTAGDPQYSTVILGSQPMWSPASFIERFEADASLRAQRARARNKDVTVREWRAEEANNHPELRRVLGEWLQTRGLPPMHFLVEPETLSSLDGRRVFVASRDGVPIGFLVLSPVPARKGWLTEQFIRGCAAPNGTVELMLYEAVKELERSGDELLTMGIVPLARHGQVGDVDNPRWLEALTKWARAHGNRFYNFEGLEWFKHKFHPDVWEPIYVISGEPRFTFRSLYAVAAAFTDMSPISALAKGIWRAAKAELSQVRN